jgi:agmatine deiminase
MPQPKPVFEKGRRLALSYINFYIANHGIIMPAFDQASDAEAAKLVQAAFPEHEIVQVQALPIVRGGGGIHCITQQQPKWPLDKA